MAAPTSPRSPAPAPRRRPPGRRAGAALAGPPVALPRWLDALSDRWWARSPRTRTVLLVAATLGAVLAFAAGPLLADAGPPVPVWVATEDLPTGHELTGTELERRRFPPDLVPPTAATSDVGTLVAPLPAGSPLTDAHLTAGGLAGLVPDGQGLVPLPLDHVPAVPIGSRVAVVVADHEGRGYALTDRGEVVADDDVSVWVAVPDELTAEVAGAALTGNLSLVLLPP